MRWRRAPTSLPLRFYVPSVAKTMLPPKRPRARSVSSVNSGGAAAPVTTTGRSAMVSLSSPCGCFRYLCWCGACVQRGRQSLQPDLEVGNSRVGFPAPTVRCCCRAASRAKQQRLQPTPTPSLATQPLPLHLDVTSADALGGVRRPWQAAEGRSAEKARRVVVRDSQRSSLREVGGIGVRVGRSRSSDRSIDRLRLGMMGWRGG